MTHDVRRAEVQDRLDTGYLLGIHIFLTRDGWQPRWGDANRYIYDSLVRRGLVEIKTVDGLPERFEPHLTEMGREYITHLLNLGSL